MATQGTVYLDRWTRGVLVVLCILLTVIAVELWAGAADRTPQAAAQIPDSGLQRHQMVDEQRRTNRLLERILEHLQSKPIRTVITTDEKKDAGRTRPAR